VPFNTLKRQNTPLFRQHRIEQKIIGCADDLTCALSCGVGNVLLKGSKAPFIGRMRMDQTMVDVSGIPDINTGDTAVIIGSSGARTITA